MGFWLLYCWLLSFWLCRLNLSSKTHPLVFNKLWHQWSSETSGRGRNQYEASRSPLSPLANGKKPIPLTIFISKYLYGYIYIYLFIYMDIFIYINDLSFFPCPSISRMFLEDVWFVEWPPGPPLKKKHKTSNLSSLHPGRLTWNIIMEVWFRSCSFLNGVICRFLSPLIFQGLSIYLAGANNCFFGGSKSQQTFKINPVN